jgi:hypothetical protein
MKASLHRLVHKYLETVLTYQYVRHIPVLNLRENIKVTLLISSFPRLLLGMFRNLKQKIFDSFSRFFRVYLSFPRIVCGPWSQTVLGNLNCQENYRKK